MSGEIKHCQPCLRISIYTGWFKDKFHIIIISSSSRHCRTKLGTGKDSEMDRNDPISVGVWLSYPTIIKSIVDNGRKSNDFRLSHDTRLSTTMAEFYTTSLVFLIC